MSASKGESTKRVTRKKSRFPAPRDAGAGKRFQARWVGPCDWPFYACTDSRRQPIETLSDFSDCSTFKSTMNRRWLVCGWNSSRRRNGKFRNYVIGIPISGPIFSPVSLPVPQPSERRDFSSLCMSTWHLDHMVARGNAELARLTALMLESGQRLPQPADVFLASHPPLPGQQ